MKRLLLTLLMLLATACHTPASTQDRVQSSIVRVTGTTIVRHPIFNSLSKEMPYSCTGFVVGEHLVMTADHCTGDKMLADGLPVKVIKKDEYYDLAVLYVANLNKPSLDLRSAPVVKGEPLLAIGYGEGWTDALGLQERVVLTNYGAAVAGRHSTGIVVQGGYIDGMSGGPVVDEFGSVVSVIQQNVDYLLGYGVSYPMIKAFLEDARVEAR